jgi:hypothetical protein
MFSAHQCSSVLNEFAKCGTTVELLPPGCTSAVQPCDNGINMPIKSANRSLSHQHKLQSFEESDEVKPPTRKQVANWISQAWSQLSTETVKNSWKCRVPFFWFENNDS